MNKIEILTLNDYQLDRTVRIDGTKYNRRNKLNPNDIKKMKKQYEKGKSIPDISALFNVCEWTVRYHCVPGFKDVVKRKPTYGNHYGKVQSVTERATYKRKLVATGKVMA